MANSPDTSRLEAIERRVEVLEERLLPDGEASAPRKTAPGDDPLWALHELRLRRSQREETADGAVLFTGSLDLPTGESVSWQEGVGTRAMFEADWSDFAASLAALGHPVRLEILKHILLGTRGTADLAEIDGLGTTGQLHHHLRELRGAGWVKQSGRGRYEVAAARVVPLLITLVAAGDR